ncbi:hypothetical protein KCU65_g18, partial [Aureobasidium melanogenum]
MTSLAELLVLAAWTDAASQCHIDDESSSFSSQETGAVFSLVLFNIETGIVCSADHLFIDLDTVLSQCPDTASDSCNLFPCVRADVVILARVHGSADLLLDSDVAIDSKDNVDLSTSVGSLQGKDFTHCAVYRTSNCACATKPSHPETNSALLQPTVLPLRRMCECKLILLNGNAARARNGTTESSLFRGRASIADLKSISSSESSRGRMTAGAAGEESLLSLDCPELISIDTANLNAKYPSEPI